MGKTLAKGTKVQVNGRHHGAKGSTGRISSVHQHSGRTYYQVRFTGGRLRGTGFMRFTATELDVIE